MTPSTDAAKKLPPAMPGGTMLMFQLGLVLGPLIGFVVYKLLQSRGLPAPMAMAGAVFVGFLCLYPTARFNGFTFRKYLVMQALAALAAAVVVASFDWLVG